MTVLPRPEWRRALHRFRHLLAAVAALAALLIVVRVFAPGTRVWALAADTPAGTTLSAAHLETVRVPRETVPFGTFTDPPTGRQLVLDLPAHTVLSESLADGDGLADLAPPGTLVFPLALADAGSRALVSPGAIVSVVAADPLDGTAQVVDGVVVLAVFESDSSSILGGGLGGGVSDNAVAVVAVPRESASFVLSASGSIPVRIAITR